jgi:hypothetical protein
MPPVRCGEVTCEAARPASSGACRDCWAGPRFHNSRRIDHSDLDGRNSKKTSELLNFLNNFSWSRGDGSDSTASVPSIPANLEGAIAADRHADPRAVKALCKKRMPGSSGGGSGQTHRSPRRRCSIGVTGGKLRSGPIEVRNHLVSRKRTVPESVAVRSWTRYTRPRITSRSPRRKVRITKNEVTASASGRMVRLLL